MSDCPKHGTRLSKSGRCNNCDAQKSAAKRRRQKREAPAK